MLAGWDVTMTIFDTPILTGLLRLLTRLLLRLSGWRVHGQVPDFPKFIVLGAPHTSNWDFMLMLAVGFVTRAKLRYLGKAELFRSPLGFFFYWCGGIPVDRSKSVGLVEQTVKVIHNSKEFILAIAPEGTREQVHRWKSGFYHIAKSAEIPIVSAYVDAKRKVVGIGDIFRLTGNMEADMRNIQSYFAKFEGIINS